jgi:hypothetical protein
MKEEMENFTHLQLDNTKSNTKRRVSAVAKRNVNIERRSTRAIKDNIRRGDIIPPIPRYLRIRQKIVAGDILRDIDIILTLMTVIDGISVQERSRKEEANIRAKGVIVLHLHPYP